MKYLKRFNEELYIEDEKNDIIYDIDDIDSVINNIESILIELKDNGIPVNINKHSLTKGDNSIVIDFGDPNPNAFDRFTLPKDEFSGEKGNIKEYINESLKTLIDYVNEIDLNIFIYVSYNNGAGPKNINYIIDVTWREIAYIKSLKIIVTKIKPPTF